MAEITESDDARLRGGPPGASDETPPGMSLGTRMLLGAILLLIVLGALNWKSEIARWHWAAAREFYFGHARQPKDLAAALAAIDVAAEYNAEDPALLFERCQWRLEAGDFAGALADCDQLEPLVPELEQRPILIERAEIYRRQGKIAESIAQLDRCVAILERKYAGQENTRLHKIDRALALNARAYYRAVAGIELDQAWMDIQQALALMGMIGEGPLMREPRLRRFLGGALPDRTSRLEEMDLLAAMLDTRAYLRLLRDEPAAALEDMQATVALAEAVFGDVYLRLMTEARGRYDRRQIDRQIERSRHNLAVMYQHRGLAHEKLGQAFAASNDLRRAKELGYNPAAGVW